MKVYIKSSSSNRYVLYEGKQIKLDEGETKPQAIARYKAQIAQEEADALEAKRLAKEEADARRDERRKTVRYPDDTVVLLKDGRYCQLYNGYYHKDDDTVYYDFMPCNPNGDWDCNAWEDDDYRWSSIPDEVDQRDIQRKVK